MTATHETTGSVLFRCADRLLALPISSVVEVFRMVSVVARLPRAPRHALGVVDCHGELVPLVDLGARLGLCAPRTEEALVDGHVIVVKDALGPVGYAVDEVRELTEAELEQVATEGRQALGAFVRGAVRPSEGGLAPLLEPAVLLTTRARHELRAALQRLSSERGT
jgi:purine-binding chemotaxis protein CheW